jgi:hypothetical protein
MFSCKNSVKQNSTDHQTGAENINTSIGRNNYAVVWDWSTEDEESMASYRIFPAGAFWLGVYDETAK